MEKYDVKNTKISPEMSKMLDAICAVMGVDVYHLLQWFCYTIIRASAPQHELTPEIQKIMTMLETDAGWQHAFNLCNPDGLDVAQVILILQQKDKRGFGAVMINRPFMSESTQTECVDDIVERVIEVCMQGVYRRLREAAHVVGSDSLLDLLLTMLDAQIFDGLTEMDRQEMQGPADYANGKRYAYGAKTKSTKRRTPDGEAARQQTIRFCDSDKDTSELEAGFRPYDQEW